MICIYFSNNFFNCCLITHIILLQSFFQLINCNVPVQECASNKVNVKGQTQYISNEKVELEVKLPAMVLIKILECFKYMILLL